MKTGVYQHYKGPYYMVLGVGRDSSEALRAAPPDGLPEYVVYIGLTEKPGPRMFVRLRPEFEEHVLWPNGKYWPRFRWIGEEIPRLSAKEVAL